MKYSCFKPKKVYNKYTKEYHYVSCRNCDYCLNARSYDLKGRIDREFLDVNNKSCYLLTFDYDNDHLPVYVYDEEKELWVSNRDFELSKYLGVKSRYTPLSDADVGVYYQPTNYSGKRAFGHLCYVDMLKWFSNVRGALHKDFKFNKEDVPDYIKKLRNLFSGLIYKDVQFRYFLCGEYGPTTFRPHYHLILWFKHSWTSSQFEYLSKVFRSNWSNGSVDIQPVNNGGVSNYVSGYVTSFANLPEVLRVKHLRPFCTFSKAPSLGSVKVDNKEIQEILTTGIVKRVKWNDREKCFIDDVLPKSFFRRNFPLCRGFGFATYNEKLRIYSYVRNYFEKKLGSNIVSRNDLDVDFNNPNWKNYCNRSSICHPHSIRDLDNIKLSDIDWQDNYIIIDGVRYSDWSYLDKYASLVAYKYTVMFDYSPAMVLDSFERIYSKCLLCLILSIKKEKGGFF